MNLRGFRLAALALLSLVLAAWQCSFDGGGSSVELTEDQFALTAGSIVIEKEWVGNAVPLEPTARFIVQDKKGRLVKEVTLSGNPASQVVEVPDVDTEYFVSEIKESLSPFCTLDLEQEQISVSGRAGEAYFRNKCEGEEFETDDVSGTFWVSATEERDPGGHSGFINMWEKGYLRAMVCGGLCSWPPQGPVSITFSGPDPWVEVSGTWETDGSFYAEGRGTVAGFSNVKVTFEGTISPGYLSGDYTMGAGGELPGGESITYGVEGPKVERVEDFVTAFVQARQSKDIDFLMSRLHPEVLELYGEDTCRSDLEGRPDDPNYNIEILSVAEPGPWNWEVDGRSIPISDVYTVQANVNAGGEEARRELHFAIVDGLLYWFTDCGEPRA